MRAWAIIIVFFGGLFALCWYGVTGETGPIGWLNSWQNSHTGSYSRGVSFFLFCVGLTVIGGLLLGLWALVAPKPAARAGAAPPPSFTAPADAKVAAMAVAMNDRSTWRWRMYLKVWLVGLALVWAAVLGWHGWDYQRRASDAHGTYTPLRLDRTTTVAHTDDGSHWALQGRLLWDHSVTHSTKDRASTTETVYVPVAGADWRPGDAIQFVARLSRSQVWTLQHRAGPADAPLRVRVDGAIPTPSRAVFQRAGAPPVEAAVAVEVLNADGGPGEADPGFDWANAKLIGAAISATWTAGLWLGAFGVLLQVWRQRRRLAVQRA